jgi:hypothetical protein
MRQSGIRLKHHDPKQPRIRKTRARNGGEIRRKTKRRQAAALVQVLAQKLQLTDRLSQAIIEIGRAVLISRTITGFPNRPFPEQGWPVTRDSNAQKPRRIIIKARGSIT